VEAELGRQAVTQRGVALGRPAASQAEGPGARVQDRGRPAIRPQPQPALLGGRLGGRWNRNLESRVGIDRAKRSDDLQPVVDLMPLAEAAIYCAMGEKASAPVVQPHPDRRAARQRQGGIFGDPEGRRQVMEEHQHVVALRSQSPAQAKRGGQGSERRPRSVEGDLVERDQAIDGIRGGQQRRAARRHQHIDLSR
jgi:hypothetical protein